MPQSRSPMIGFFLCGIADDPFWPLPKNSSTSCTSVRCRWRNSCAQRSIDAPTSASAVMYSACRSRCRICVEIFAGFSPSFVQTYFSTNGSRCACVPTAPESWPTRTISRAASNRASARPNSSTISAILRPNVIGSAWMPCVRPIIGVYLYFFAFAAAARRTALRPAIRMSAACTIWTESDVSRMSELVSPLWMNRDDGPTYFATLVRNAITSWFVFASMRSISLTLNFARCWMRLRSAAGTTPSLFIASQASTSILSQVANLFSSVQIAPISGRVYRGIMLAPR